MFFRFCASALLLFCPQVHSVEPLDRFFSYQVRIAVFNAGDLNFQLSSSSMNYGFFGEFETSGLINRYYRWKGEFSGLGRYENGWPKTSRYYARSESKDHELKIVVLTDRGVRLLETGEKFFQDLARPKGDDLISAFFFSPDCYTGNYLNDGEDTFEVVLIKKRELSQTSSRFPSIRRCYYKVKDYKGRTRKLNVELVRTENGIVASEIRIKVPLLPDIVFGLKDLSYVLGLIGRRLCRLYLD